MRLGVYWPQHKIFFLATVALFPDMLKERALDPVFSKPYFNGADYPLAETMLNDYQRLGYIEYRKDRFGNFEVLEANSPKALSDLTVYLMAWREGKLRTITDSKPPSISGQNKMLMVALNRAFLANPDQPRLNSTDVYGDASAIKYTPPFWELILSLQLIDDKVKIEQLGYGRRLSGTYADDALPYVDLGITDEALLEDMRTSGQTVLTEMKTSLPSPTSLRHTITLRSYDPESGTLFFGSYQIIIIAQKKRRGKRTAETSQGTIMRKLFKSVNTLNDGVKLRSLTTVKTVNFGAPERKLIVNHLSEINKKVKEVTNVPRLINYDTVNCCIDSSYLK
jgi:hypothetical protein